MNPRIVSGALLAVVLCSGLSAQPSDWPAPPPVQAAAYLVVEATSGQVLAESRADERRAPASLTKLMTAYLAFDALYQKKLSLTQRYPLPERAWRVEGSRAFARPGVPVTGEDLVRGLIVASGNDAAIALAQVIAGGEGAFVDAMNREAQRLGLVNTRFMNASGLPEQGQYSTARDLAQLALALERDFPQYRRVFAERSFTHGGVTVANRNSLLASDPSVDGMKTGQAEAAGFNLVATAYRPPRRVLVVLLGAPSDGARAADARRLIEWAFTAFEAERFHEAGQVVEARRVWKSDVQTLPIGFRSDVVAVAPTGQRASLSTEWRLREPLVAPIRAGEPVGTLRVKRAGHLLYEREVIALESAPEAGLIKRAWHGLLLWAQRVLS
ncbi:MAG: D-alanyl-D-alanine carboxypeptidase [Casimicrobiaceae bacterium]|nr:D-alanyl-D-alanine carboxypeptidase [Casimicrobiaceae bacterium]MDW8312063.1 D-alanyl-D-alanine carboxypeptidase family protein [Burkholderiales bacterium]